LKALHWPLNFARKERNTARYMPVVRCRSRRRGSREIGRF